MREAIEYKDLRMMQIDDFINNTSLGHLLRFEYEKDELKKRAQLFIDSLNA